MAHRAGRRIPQVKPLSEILLRCNDGIELGDTSAWSTTIGGS